MTGTTTRPRGRAGDELRAFDYGPLIVARTASECGCIWVYAPRKSGVAGMPWVIKFVRRELCESGHA